MLPSPFTLSTEEFIELERLDKIAKNNHIKHSKCVCNRTFGKTLVAWIKEDEKHAYHSEWQTKNGINMLVVDFRSRYGSRMKSYKSSTFIDSKDESIGLIEIPDSPEFFEWAHRIMSDITTCEIQEKQWEERNMRKYQNYLDYLEKNKKG